MFTYKIVMVGDFGVGKTSLVKRFVDDSFSEEYLSTIGVSISKKKLDDSTLMLWDIEGHTEFKPIMKQYLMGAKGFIIVADIGRKETIDAITKHIEFCHSVVADAPLCIAINKSDTIASISEQEIERLETCSTSVVKVLKTSAKESLCVEELFHALDMSVVKQIKGI